MPNFFVLLADWWKPIVWFAIPFWWLIGLVIVLLIVIAAFAIPAGLRADRADREKRADDQ